MQSLLSSLDCLHMSNIKFVSAASQQCYLYLSYNNITVQIIYTQIYIQNIYMHLHASVCLHLHVCMCISICINYSYTTTRIHFISHVKHCQEQPARIKSFTPNKIQVLSICQGRSYTTHLFGEIIRHGQPVYVAYHFKDGFSCKSSEAHFRCIGFF